MKKLFIATIVALFALTQSNAQVTFQPGIRGGVNFSHLTKGDSFQDFYYDNNGNYVSTTERREFNSKTDFYIGFFGALKLTKYYTLQPEIDYSRQGAVFKAVNFEERLDVSYLSVAVVNKFTFNDKFNVHIGPTIDFVVDNSSNFDPDSEVDLAFQLGMGYNFTNNFGLEARIKKGIVPVLDFSQSDHTNVVFSVGATYTFDVK